MEINNQPVNSNLEQDLTKVRHVFTDVIDALDDGIRAINALVANLNASDEDDIRTPLLRRSLQDTRSKMYQRQQRLMALLDGELDPTSLYRRALALVQSTPSGEPVPVQLDLVPPPQPPVEVPHRAKAKAKKKKRVQNLTFEERTRRSEAMKAMWVAGKLGPARNAEPRA